MEEVSQRCFFAVMLNHFADDLYSQLQPLQQQIDSKLKIRWLKPEQLHLTLRFLGNVTQDQINELIYLTQSSLKLNAEIRPFELQTDCLAWFPKAKNTHVLVTKLRDHPLLTKIYKLIEQNALAIALEPEARAFNPHITIARMKQHYDVREFDINGPINLQMTVSGISLMASRTLAVGAEYSCLQSFGLSK